MEKCVSNFNRMIEKEESIKKKKLKNTKHGRSKNGFSKRPLTLLEFQKFIGFMFATVTRVEFDVNLWKYTNSSSHFLVLLQILADLWTDIVSKRSESIFMSVSQKPNNQYNILEIGL